MATLNLPKEIRARQVVLKYEEEVYGNERGIKIVDVARFGMTVASYVEKNEHKFGYD